MDNDKIEGRYAFVLLSAICVFRCTSFALLHIFPYTHPSTEIFIGACQNFHRENYD